jgi:hypothetical protein
VAVVTFYESKADLAQVDPGAERGATLARLPAGDEGPASPPLSRVELPLTASADLATASPAGGATASTRVSSQLEQVKGKLAEIQREKRDLEAQLRSLESELVQRPRSAPAGEAYEFELDRDDWKELAAQARIKYRIPCALPAESSYAIPQDQLDELGLSPDDGKTLLEAHRRSNARVWATLRPLCLKAVGDETVVDLLGRSNCMGVIERAVTKTDFAAATDTRRQVGEVHAGTGSPPEAGQATPLFQALMALTSEARHFEADLAENFGPEDAQRIVQSMHCADTTR